ncbi:alkaline phosphatase [Bacteroides sp. 224]|uniref:alkaline phosphatase n=1 Tax=Bacteroides sp. 224 TaxID=2302936 RepID=UPI0013D7B0AF|nr:alkaline phosphatase [Bacteroides sp. 224]NDV65682.1 alkaline phosphatase [Bacteroides sp. 224]
MKQKIILSILALVCFCTIYAQTYNGNAYRKSVTPTKNVIVMIPDGTSMGVVSAARWYQIYNKLGGENLAIDPYFCGTVKTFSSNAPIGDSAPTTSAYMTGMPQQTGNVAIYPPADPEKDLVTVDPEMAYQPLATILEAARIEKNKATGLVVTVEFPHATPADCAAHHYNRGKYKQIAPQMAHQNLDVMFGGGVSIITDDIKQHFQNKNIAYYANDINAFRRHNEGKVWSLWCDNQMPYDIDHDKSEIPSLQEMTEKALNLLSKNENGFFLMVEGSKVDWVAHANDAVGCITEFLAFDKAVASVMEFAKKDGNTTVIILPDHGNSGFTIGRRDLPSYDKASIHQLFANVSKYKRTAEGMERILLKEKPENFKKVIKEYTNIDITDEELKQLIESENYKPQNYMKVSDGKNMIAKLVEFMNKRTYFGFTTGGHTGEEVFLAAYHPQGDIPTGMNTNVEINHYLSDALGLEKRLPELTQEIFAKHTDVFEGLKYSIDKSDPDFPVLIIKKGKKKLEIPAFKSVAYLNKKEIELGSVTVYIKRNDTFYLPKELKNKF